MIQRMLKEWFMVSLLLCAVKVLRGQEFVHQDYKVPLKTTLTAFEKKYNINIIYRENIVQNKMVVPPKTDSYNIDTALHYLLTPFGLTFKKITATQIIITETSGSKKGEKGDVHGQQNLLKGTVINEFGEPMPNATVIITGISRGTVTDANGNYQLSVSNGTHKILFSSIGYNSHATTVKVENTDIKRDIVLYNAVADLSGVVVTVGSRASQRTFTNTALPVDNINAAELQTTGQLSFDKALQLRAPSFNTINMPVHDATSLSDPYEIRNLGPSRTLILINGKRKNPGALVYIQTSPGRGETETDLSAIPIDAIKRVEILRDGASAQYGSDAIAGVMNIILKDRFEYTNFKVASGITHKGDGFSLSTSINSGANIGTKGFINYTVNLQKEDKTNRPGKVDAEQDNIDLGDGTAAGLAQVKTFLARFPDANNINGTPVNTSAKFLVNTGIPLKDNITFYANAAYVYKKIQSYANYRTPYWKQDPYNLLHAAGTEYLGFGPTFAGDLNDYNATVGLKSNIDNFNTDISLTVGGNRQLYLVTNTWNPSLEAQSPTSFSPGGYGFNHVVGNIDITKTVNDRLSIGFGYEFRNERFRIIEGDTASYAGDGPISFLGISAMNATKAYRFNIGGYLDVSYDLSKAVLINATARQEYYNDFGSAFVWKVSGRAKLVGDKLTLRSSLSTGFRAPGLHQVNLQIAQQIFVPGNGIQTKGVISNKSLQAQLLGVPALKPERSLNFTAGFGMRPSKDFSLTLDYYNIDIKDRIILSSNIGHTSTGNTQLDDVLSANGIVGVSFFTNGIRTNTQGIDLVANYRNIQIHPGSWLNVSLAGNYTISNRLRGMTSTPKLIANTDQVIFDYTQEALLLTSRPKYKAILSGDLTLNKWSFFLNNILFGPATFRSEGLDRNIKLVFKSKVVTDVHISYQFNHRWSTSLAVNNMLNILPAYRLKALNTEGKAVLSDAAAVKKNINAITFNGRYGIVTYDGSHFSQLGTTFLATVNFKL
jgi:iron complex outermembrane receptor protein